MYGLQEEEERKVRREYRPANRRTAQQVKADEDFALRMQRQEREIEQHQVSRYMEAQRQQDAQFDMGGVPPQSSKVHCCTSPQCAPVSFSLFCTCGSHYILLFTWQTLPH